MKLNLINFILFIYWLPSYKINVEKKGLVVFSIKEPFILNMKGNNCVTSKHFEFNLYKNDIHFETSILTIDVESHGISNRAEMLVFMCFFLLLLEQSQHWNQSPSIIWRIPHQIVFFSTSFH